MFVIFSKNEWDNIIQKYPTPNDTIKEEIWNKTRFYDLPLVEISDIDAKEDFHKLSNLQTKDFLKTDQLFSRYEYKWELGKNYIDLSNIGNKSSNLFHQDLRYKCDSINSPSPYRTWYDKKFFFTLLNGLWSLKIKEVTSETLRSCIAMRKYIASQFRPSAAKFIYEYFEAENILDFSSGWGDRLVAALATNSVKSYIGIDPNFELKNRYEKMINFYNIKNKNIEQYYEPAEDILPKINLKNSPDLIFTSPPYFIIERYSKEKNQSWQRYKKIDKWLNGFLFPVIEESWKLLKSGGHMAINISDVYCLHQVNHICDPMNDFISNLTGSEKKDNINYRMAKRINSKSDQNGIFVEPVWIWKKN
jgi:16S rRNA G966 N2-methylase RsmD